MKSELSSPVVSMETCSDTAEVERLRERVSELEARIVQNEARRRALLHIMGDLATTNRKLGESRKAMLHILGDYEADRSRLAKQTERLDNSRRALLHILSDAHSSNLRLEDTRKAMIHIMGDLRETTEEMGKREQELRDKQEQLVQAGKLATLGELTTGVAHELNNPLNNIQLFLGNILDMLERGHADEPRIQREIEKALAQVGKASQIITHLRVFGRVALVSQDEVDVNDVILRSLDLLHEQLRLRDISVVLSLPDETATVLGNAIQLEQAFLNIIGNARDALEGAAQRRISIDTGAGTEQVHVNIRDSGPGIPPGNEQRIFDPFFTTKDVGKGTGLGLSITYGIIKEHHGDISVRNTPEGGACFTIVLPRAQRSGATP